MTEIVKKAPVRIGGAVGLAAKKAAALAAEKEQEAIVDPRLTPMAPPAEMPDRIGIVMDDSGSMSGQKITDAHAGIDEFLRCCKPTTTAVCIYPMNEEPIRLNTTLPQTAIMIQKIKATGGTPLLETLDAMIAENSITRAIVFSDGSPNSEFAFDSVVAECVKKEIPVDTVYIAGSWGHELAESFMKRLAEATGGIFMKFEAGKGTFRGSFKYLAPGTRMLLMDDNFRARVERGEV